MFRRPLNWINLKSNSGVCLHQAGHCERCSCAHCSTAHAPVPHPPGPYQSIRERKMVARGASGAKIDRRKTRLDLFIHNWRKRFVRSVSAAVWLRCEEEVRAGNSSVSLCWKWRFAFKWKSELSCENNKASEQAGLDAPPSCSFPTCVSRHAKLIPDNKAARMEEL